ncbi:MAG: WecB/TagA/CpsF family glycosyltransferase, partial [Desulfatiglans sp.]|nr:WecB/TagA/CpsF family glycosyltransferase [Desulfatiglans sp.]
DGAGVVLGAKMLGRNIPKRLTWADWGWMLASYLAEQQHSVYLLGGPLGAASETAKRLKERSPTLRITGTHHGYFQKSGAENMRVIKQINDLNPDVLVVGMGMPLQEEWILRNHSQIRAKVFVTAGAAFEYLSGSLRRCPQWMADSGMEWLFRLLLEPKRMARRYLLGNTIFLFSVVRERFGMLKV